MEECLFSYFRSYYYQCSIFCNFYFKLIVKVVFMFKKKAFAFIFSALLFCPLLSYGMSLEEFRLKWGGEEYVKSVEEQEEKRKILDAQEQQRLESENPQQGNLYRNDEYKFRINFPAGWEIKDGDGTHVVKKAVKDGCTVMVLIQDFLSDEEKKSLSKQEIAELNSANLSDFTDEEANQFLERMIEANNLAFPGSKVIEKDIRFIDNRKAVYFKVSTPYKVANLEVSGIAINYFTIHNGRLYQIGGMYPTAPTNEKDKEPAINASLMTFVFEDWNEQSQKEANLANGSLNSDGEILKLKTQAQNEVLDKFIKLFATGIFLVILAGLTGLISWLYSKITGKEIQNEKIEDGKVAVSRVKRMANFSIDFFIVINSIFSLIAYLSIQKEWYGFFAYWWFFWVGGIIFYYLFFEGLFGRTLGKFITGTRVVATDDRKPNFGQIFGRTLVRLVPFEVFSFMGTDPQGWHDKWSGTMVVQSGFKPTDEIISTETKYCKECGNPVHASATICNKCNKIISR